MKHLIVYAHPHESSFCHAILEIAVKTLQDKGDSVVVRDLYKLGFNPVLSAKDFADLRGGEIPSDIAKEQEYIKEADCMTFIYPLWWTSMPAILKGYIDRIFAYGFAYQFAENGDIEGLLGDKKVFIISTQGTPNDIYDASGMSEALKQTTDIGVFGFCGMNVLEHMFLGKVNCISEQERTDMLQKVKSAF